MTSTTSDERSSLNTNNGPPVNTPNRLFVLLLLNIAARLNNTPLRRAAGTSCQKSESLKEEELAAENVQGVIFFHKKMESVMATEIYFNAAYSEPSSHLKEAKIGLSNEDHYMIINPEGILSLLRNSGDWNAYAPLDASVFSRPFSERCEALGVPVSQELKRK